MATYTLIGEEDLLVEIALSKIKKEYMPKEDLFNFVSIDGKTKTSSQIIDECGQLPIMHNVRMVVVKDAEKIIDDRLLEYIQNPTETTCLVLLIRKIDKRLNAYKLLEKYTEIQEFNHPSETETTDWIKHYIHNKKKHISSDDASYIAHVLENNLTGIVQELDKLITYTGSRENITEEDIDLLIKENKIRDGFTLVEEIQNKNTSGAIKLVNDLLDQGNSTQQIIGTIRWMLTRLWQAKEIKDRSTLSKELRIPPYFLNKFIAQKEKFSTEELKDGLYKLLAIERLMRTYNIPQRLILELLVIQLTEKTIALVKA